MAVKTKKIKATAKTSLTNNTEMHVGDTPPLYPEIGQLWLNTSVKPPALYKWNGAQWELQEMDVEKLDPELIESINGKIDENNAAVLNEIKEINEAAERMKQEVEERNKQDDAYFQEMQETIINNRLEALGWYQENNGSISGIAQSMDGILTRVTNVEGDAATAIQTANGLQSTVSSIANGTHSVITQLSDRINLKVSKDGIISQINASTEGLYLAGKLIYLDGNVKVDGTFTAPKVVSTNSGNTEYTKIENRTLTSYGNFSGTWRSGYYSGNHQLTANVGYIKMQQLDGTYNDSKPALYYTAKGISTYANGNSSASGSIEFFARAYGYGSSNNGIMITSSGNIVLESTSSGSNTYNKNIYINPNGGNLVIGNDSLNQYYNIICGTIDAGTLKAGQFYTNSTNLNSYDDWIKISGTNGNIVSKGSVSFASGGNIQSDSYNYFYFGNFYTNGTNLNSKNDAIKIGGSTGSINASGTISASSFSGTSGSFSSLTFGAFTTTSTNINASNGAIKIGNSGNINISGTLSCSKVSESSRREIKKNIESYEGNATELITDTPIRTYQYIDDVEGIDLPYVGLILDEAPLEVVDTKGHGVLIAQGVWLSWKAIQELNERISKLEGELKNGSNQ